MNERIKKAVKAANAKGIDALLIKGVNNVRYFTGFTGDSSEALMAGDKLYFFTDFRYIEQAENELAGIFGAEIIKTTRSQRTKEIFDRVKRHNVRRIGIDEDQVSVEDFEAYRQNHPSEGFAFFGGDIYALRAVKDEDEISAIAAGAKENDAAFAYLVDFIKPGMRESEIAAELVYYFQKKGLGIAFPPIVVSGEKTSLPHGQPSNSEIKKGEFVTMDFGCKVAGYCSDFTRTIAVGGVDEEMRKVYELVKTAQNSALNAGKAGMQAKMLDNSARQVIIDKGYGECFEHGLGHGVGLDIHEAPTVNAESGEELVQNMVITVEPGIYIKGRFGVRIEDLCVVRDGSLQNLSAAQKHLVII